MRRIILMTTVAALVAAMLAFGAAPAVAEDDSSWWGDWGDAVDNSWWSPWSDPVDIDDITDADFDDGVWEFEATGELFGAPADFEFACELSGACQVEDVDLA